MVSYNTLNVGDPLAFVFDQLHLKWMSGIIAVSAVVLWRVFCWFFKWDNRVSG